MVKVGILGAASYVAGELIKLLLMHPKAEISYLESETYVDREIGSIHPTLKSVFNKKCASYDKDNILNKCEALFICKAHTKSMDFVLNFLDTPIKIVDLSADFRLKCDSVYQKYYGKKHSCPQLLNQAVYGLPEIHAEQIKRTALIANPGCYATSVILGTAPLVAAEVVETNKISVTAYSGLSGAGKTPKPGFNLFLDAFANIKPYKAGSHQHLPEMEQELQALSGSGEVKITFVPHLVPVERGIMSNIVLNANRLLTNESILRIYQDFYKGQPFIQIYDPPQMPQLSEVVGTNFCSIGWFYDKRTNLITVTSAIDNVLKGAAGQAVQCMNIMLDFPQTDGLPWGSLLLNKH